MRNHKPRISGGPELLIADHGSPGFVKRKMMYAGMSRVGIPHVRGMVGIVNKTPHSFGVASVQV